jgi:hypothetical protein
MRQAVGWFATRQDSDASGVPILERDSMTGLEAGKNG